MREGKNVNVDSFVGFVSTPATETLQIYASQPPPTQRERRTGIKEEPPKKY